MKNNIKYKLLLVACMVLSLTNVSAQQVNTMYFMDNVPFRNQLNPAFQPYSNFYLGFPVLGYTQLGIGNNSLTLKDFVYEKNGQLISYLHPNGSVDNFYNALRRNTLLQANAQLNLLSFGFRTGRSYWNFTLNEKINTKFNVPKDLMKLMLYGTPNKTNNAYNFSTLGFDISAYTEAGLGYSINLTDKLAVGAKLKALFGTANLSSSLDNLTLNAGIDEWVIKGGGALRFASPATIETSDLSNINPTFPSQITDYLKPVGLGGALDLGATYKLTNDLTLSAALIDLGMIRWYNNTNQASFNIDYKFDGLTGLTIDSFNQGNQAFDSLLNKLQNSVKDSIMSNVLYTTRLSPKLNVGAEYAFFDNKLSVGLLSSTQLYNKAMYEELTASVNGRPIDWFNLSASYSVLNGRMSNIGAGLGIRTGFIHWFLSADYIPLRYTDPYPVVLGSSTVNLPLPYNTKGLNFALGINFVFGNRKDADKDGVVDRKDKCPETPFSVVVDKKGCPVDSDGDGVPDYLDKCPGTPPEAYSRINQDGCPIDSDGDGVADYLDQCPDTPAEAFGHIDLHGCPLDTDADGIFDYKDKCANTPAGVKVDSVGCPLDTDGDGVADYLDKCPDTPVAARTMVDSVGCPLDKDLDGVPDYLDLCPNTPAEARAYVDKNGCTLDTDGDGVADYLDKCPDTPLEARGAVDEKGCPRDTDGDGVLDYQDNCPKIPGTVSNKGCPEIKKEIKKLFQRALQGIQFETGKYVIKPVSFVILDQIAKVLIENPTYLIEVQGHTDNVGKPEANLTLSDNRANAVKEYLIKKGVAAARMTSHGYGDTKPVASNKTTKGKALNRRVEFVVSFEETVTE